MCTSSHASAPSPPFPTPFLRTNTASRRPGFARRFRPMIRFVRGGDPVRADRPDYPVHTSKEVTMFKRVTIVALVVAAFLLMVAVPAMALNGYRGDYTTTGACEVCHNGIAGIPAVYGDWVQTKHAVAGADGQALRLPYGSSCAGCHTSNFDPSKVIPTPTATATTGVVSWAAANGIPTELSDRRIRGIVRELRRLLVVPLRRQRRRRSCCGRRRPERHCAHGADGQPGQRRHLRPVPFAVLVHGEHLHRGADPVRQGDYTAARHADHAESESDDAAAAAVRHRLQRCSASPPRGSRTR